MLSWDAGCSTSIKATKHKRSLSPGPYKTAAKPKHWKLSFRVRLSLPLPLHLASFPFARPVIDYPFVAKALRHQDHALPLAEALQMHVLPESGMEKEGCCLLDDRQMMIML